MADTTAKFIAPKSIAIRKEPVKGFDKKLQKTRTLMGGTEAMRMAGKQYLPQFEGESDKHYEDRKALSFLFNGFRKTVWDMAGRVFEKPVTLSDDSAPELISYSEDIDLEGQDLSTFAKSVFEEGMQSGIEYLLVDAPVKEGRETKAEAISSGNRPYIVHLKPEAVLGWRFARINNTQTLEKFWFKERVSEKKDEFSEENVDQIRVLDIEERSNVRVRMFRLNKRGEWEQYGEETRTGLTGITVTPFYANRKSLFVGEPPLEDLSDLNIAHWQSQSDQRNILHFTRVPILFGKGIPEKGKLMISAASITKATSPEADLKFVEHSGKAIAAGQKDLEHLEFQMETMGLQLIVAQNGPQTATGEERNDRKENSRLASMADSLKDALEICFKWMAEYDGLEFKGSVSINKDFGAGSMSQPILNILIQAVLNGKMSKRTFWKEMVRRGIYSEDFDADAEEILIDDEADDELTDGMLGIEGQGQDDEEGSGN
jgi:hypothetical protein